LKYKKLLIVHEKPVAFVQDKNEEQVVRISEIFGIFPV
jgi:hypothetical protein